MKKFVELLLNTKEFSENLTTKQSGETTYFVITAQEVPVNSKKKEFEASEKNKLETGEIKKRFPKSVMNVFRCFSTYIEKINKQYPVPTLEEGYTDSYFEGLKARTAAARSNQMFIDLIVGFEGSEDVKRFFSYLEILCATVSDDRLSFCTDEQFYDFFSAHNMIDGQKEVVLFIINNPAIKKVLLEVSENVSKKINDTKTLIQMLDSDSQLVATLNLSLNRLDETKDKTIESIKDVFYGLANIPENAADGPQTSLQVAAMNTVAQKQVTSGQLKAIKRPFARLNYYNEKHNEEDNENLSKLESSIQATQEKVQLLEKNVEFLKTMGLEQMLKVNPMSDAIKSAEGVIKNSNKLLASVKDTKEKGVFQRENVAKARNVAKENSIKAKTQHSSLGKVLEQLNTELVGFFKSLPEKGNGENECSFSKTLRAENIDTIVDAINKKLSALEENEQKAVISKFESYQKLMNVFELKGSNYYMRMVVSSGLKLVVGDTLKTIFTNKDEARAAYKIASTVKKASIALAIDLVGSQEQIEAINSELPNELCSSNSKELIECLKDLFAKTKVAETQVDVLKPIVGDYDLQLFSILGSKEFSSEEKRIMLGKVNQGFQQDKSSLNKELLTRLHKEENNNKHYQKCFDNYNKLNNQATNLINQFEALPTKIEHHMAKLTADIQIEKAKLVIQQQIKTIKKSIAVAGERQEQVASSKVKQLSVELLSSFMLTLSESNKSLLSVVTESTHVVKQLKLKFSDNIEDHLKKELVTFDSVSLAAAEARKKLQGLKEKTGTETADFLHNGKMAITRSLGEMKGKLDTLKETLSKIEFGLDLESEEEIEGFINTVIDAKSDFLKKIKMFDIGERTNSFSDDTKQLLEEYVQAFEDAKKAVEGFNCVLDELKLKADFVVENGVYIEKIDTLIQYSNAFQKNAQVLQKRFKLVVTHSSDVELSSLVTKVKEEAEKSIKQSLSSPGSMAFDIANATMLPSKHIQSYRQAEHVIGMTRHHLTQVVRSCDLMAKINGKTVALTNSASVQKKYAAELNSELKNIVSRKGVSNENKLKQLKDLSTRGGSSLKKIRSELDVNLKLPSLDTNDAAVLLKHTESHGDAIKSLQDCGQVFESIEKSIALSTTIIECSKSIEYQSSILEKSNNMVLLTYSRESFNSISSLIAKAIENSSVLLNVVSRSRQHVALSKEKVSKKTIEILGDVLNQFETTAETAVEASKEVEKLQRQIDSKTRILLTDSKVDLQTLSTAIHSEQVVLDGMLLNLKMNLNQSSKINAQEFLQKVLEAKLNLFNKKDILDKGQSIKHLKIDNIELADLTTNYFKLHENVLVEMQLFESKLEELAGEVKIIESNVDLIKKFEATAKAGQGLQERKQALINRFNKIVSSQDVEKVSEAIVDIDEKANEICDDILSLRHKLTDKSARILMLPAKYQQRYNETLNQLDQNKTDLSRTIQLCCYASEINTKTNNLIDEGENLERSVSEINAALKRIENDADLDDSIKPQLLTDLIEAINKKVDYLQGELRDNEIGRVFAENDSAILSKLIGRYSGTVESLKNTRENLYKTQESIHVAIERVSISLDLAGKSKAIQLIKNEINAMPDVIKASINNIRTNSSLLTEKKQQRLLIINQQINQFQVKASGELGGVSKEIEALVEAAPAIHKTHANRRAVSCHAQYVAAHKVLKIALNQAELEVMLFKTLLLIQTETDALKNTQQQLSSTLDKLDTDLKAIGGKILPVNARNKALGMIRSKAELLLSKNVPALIFKELQSSKNRLKRLTVRANTYSDLLPGNGQKDVQNQLDLYKAAYAGTSGNAKQHTHLLLGWKIKINSEVKEILTYERKCLASENKQISVCGDVFQAIKTKLLNSPYLNELKTSANRRPSKKALIDLYISNIKQAADLQQLMDAVKANPTEVKEVPFKLECLRMCSVIGQLVDFKNLLNLVKNSIVVNPTSQTTQANESLNAKLQDLQMIVNQIIIHDKDPQCDAKIRTFISENVKHKSVLKVFSNVVVGDNKATISALQTCYRPSFFATKPGPSIVTVASKNPISLRDYREQKYFGAIKGGMFTSNVSATVGRCQKIETLLNTIIDDERALAYKSAGIDDGWVTIRDDSLSHG